MDALWIGLIATSVIAFLLKYLGHSVPEKWLSHPRVLKDQWTNPHRTLKRLGGGTDIYKWKISRY
jgi:hypothetical protein